MNSYFFTEGLLYAECNLLAISKFFVGRIYSWYQDYPIWWTILSILIITVLIRYDTKVMQSKTWRIASQLSLPHGIRN